KVREVRAGHDGTWVAHPGLVPLAKAVFDGAMPGPHQIGLVRADVRASASDLLAIPQGEITEKGLRTNIDVGIRYLEAWLRGTGCVPIHHLMEDAATAEISRSQVWQWVRHGARLSSAGTGTTGGASRAGASGASVTPELVERTIGEELAKIREEIGAATFDAGRFDDASALFARMMTSPSFTEFMTLPAYELI